MYGDALRVVEPGVRAADRSDRCDVAVRIRGINRYADRIEMVGDVDGTVLGHRDAGWTVELCARAADMPNPLARARTIDGNLTLNPKKKLEFCEEHVAVRVQGDAARGPYAEIEASDGSHVAVRIGGENQQVAVTNPPSANQIIDVEIADHSRAMPSGSSSPVLEPLIMRIGETFPWAPGA